MFNKYIQQVKNKIIRKPRSLFFFTHHKSASTLFGNLVLSNIIGLEKKDFAAEIYKGTLTNEPSFAERGFAYGPIRVWPEPDNPESQLLMEPCLEQSFLKDKKTLIFVRDPRDVVVSFYFSILNTHSISEVPAIAKIQNHRISEAQNLGLNEFSISIAPKVATNYALLQEIYQRSKESIILRYEDMVENFSSFSMALRSFVPIQTEVLNQLELESRPLAMPNSTSHKRSGLPGAYRCQLNPSTIATLDTIFYRSLAYFQYIQKC